MEQALRTGEVAASSPSKTIAASFCAEQAVRAWGTSENAEVYCLLATLLLNTAVACAVFSSRSGTVCAHGTCRLPPHVWSRCRLAPWPVLATLVSICSHRQAFCFWQETFRRLLSHNVSRRICKLVMDYDFLLLDRSWARVIKCDLTSGMFVVPVRSSINWKKIGQRSPFAPCSNSLLCVTPFVTYIASIGSWM